MRPRRYAITLRDYAHTSIDSRTHQSIPEHYCGSGLNMVSPCFLTPSALVVVQAIVTISTLFSIQAKVTVLAPAFDMIDSNKQNEGPPTPSTGHSGEAKGCVVRNGEVASGEVRRVSSKDAISAAKVLLDMSRSENKCLRCSKMCQKNRE